MVDFLYLPSYVIIILISSGLVWIGTYFFVTKDQRKSLLVVLFSLSCLGATIGITGGASRVGVVGQIMAAVMGLLGGVVIWIFAADRSNGTIVSVCVISFSLSVFLGYQKGASLSVLPRSYEFWRGHCIEKFTDVEAMNDPTTFASMDKSFARLCANIFKSENQILLVE